MTNSSPASTSSGHGYGGISSSPKARSSKKQPSRQRPLQPDVNARNLRLEKQRREQLNNNLVDIARLLPALASTKRPSKKLVVLETIRHLKQRRELCVCAARDVRGLLAENQRLVSELNVLRSQVSGDVTMQPQDTLAPTEAIIQLMSVETEPQGDFPDGFSISLGPRQSAGAKAWISDQIGQQPDSPSPMNNQSSQNNRTNAPNFPIISQGGDPPPLHTNYQTIGVESGVETDWNVMPNNNDLGNSISQVPQNLYKDFPGVMGYDLVNQPNIPTLPEGDFMDPAMSDLIQDIPVANNISPEMYTSAFNFWHDSGNWDTSL